MAKLVFTGTARDSAGHEATRTCEVELQLPPPPSSGEPVYDATRDHLILRDDFSYATWAACQQRYNVGRGFQYCELTPGRAGNALRIKYGLPAWADDVIFGPETKLESVGGWGSGLPQKAGPYSHFLFTTWLRASAGSDPAENDNTGSGIKGLMFWAQGGGRYQNAVNRLQHEAVGKTRGPKGANPDNATSGLNLYKTADGKAPLWSSTADGQWHRFTIEIYAGNHPSGKRGERYWLDGQLVYEDIGVPVPGHYTYANPVSHWMVFGNFINASARSNGFTIDFDEWIAWTPRA